MTEISEKTRINKDKIGETDMCRKRQEALLARNRRKKELEQQRSTTNARIAELQRELREIEIEHQDLRDEKIPWNMYLLRLLQAVLVDKCGTIHYIPAQCRWFGRCEGCWLRQGDACDESYDETGCNLKECSCSCHHTAEQDLTSVYRIDRSVNDTGHTRQALLDRVKKSLDDIVRDTDEEIDPIRYLTKDEKLETLGEFARGMRLINTEYCALICEKWVRVLCG